MGLFNSDDPIIRLVSDMSYTSNGRARHGDGVRGSCSRLLGLVGYLNSRSQCPTVVGILGVSIEDALATALTPPLPLLQLLKSMLMKPVGNGRWTYIRIYKNKPRPVLLSITASDQERAHKLLSIARKPIPSTRCLGHSLSGPSNHGTSQDFPVRSPRQVGATSAAAPLPRPGSTSPCRASRW